MWFQFHELRGHQVTWRLIWGSKEAIVKDGCCFSLHIISTEGDLLFIKIALSILLDLSYLGLSALVKKRMHLCLVQSYGAWQGAPHVDLSDAFLNVRGIVYNTGELGRHFHLGYWWRFAPLGRISRSDCLVLACFCRCLLDFYVSGAVPIVKWSLKSDQIIPILHQLQLGGGLDLLLVYPLVAVTFVVLLVEKATNDFFLQLKSRMRIFGFDRCGTDIFPFVTQLWKAHLLFHVSWLSYCCHWVKNKDCRWEYACRMGTSPGHKLISAALLTPTVFCRICRRLQTVEDVLA